MKAVLVALLLGCLAFNSALVKAQCSDEACVRTSSTTGNVTTRQSALLDGQLNSLLGTGQTIDLTVANDNALASANIKVGDLTSALNAQGVGTDASTALSTSASLSTVLTAMSSTARAEGNVAAADALDLLKTQTATVNAGTVRLGDLISTDTRSGPLASAQLNVLDLVTGTASLFNSKNVASINQVALTGSELGLGSGIANVQLATTVIEPALFVCGPAGTQFYSANIRVRARVQLTGQGVNLTIPGLTSARLDLASLDLVAAVGRASGTIQAVDALAGTLTVQATPGIAELYLGTISDTNFLDRTTAIDPVTEVTPAVIANLSLKLLLVNATASVSAKSYAKGATPAPKTLGFSGPYPQTLTASTQSGFAGTLVDTLLSNLVVTVGPIMPSLGIIGPALTTLLSDLLSGVTGNLKSASGVLKPVLDDLTSGVIDPVLQSAGVKLGEVSVTAYAPYQVAAGSACNDLAFCTENDVCGATGVCAGTAKSCSDGLSCTSDTCSEATGSCTNTPSNSCLINGACYAADAPDPSNDCRACNPAASTTSFTLRAVGASCSDGLFCTTGDACTALGVCVAQPRSCDDGLLCTLDGCDEANDRCTNNITVGCVVGGTCVLPGADDPGNPCKSCNALISNTGFSNKSAGALCTDGLFCTTGDACDGAGSCTSSPRNCEDGLGCTVNGCDEAADACNASLAGGCLISGTCVAAGSDDPTNACRSCNPAVSTLTYTNKVAGTGCSDGLFCTTGDACSAVGQCTGAPRACDPGGQGCSSVCDEAQDVCRAEAGGCLIDGACIAAGSDDPGNSCRSCVPTSSTTAWTNKGSGTSCSDGAYCTTADACNGAGACVGSARDCGDGLGCTTDSCDETNDRCTAAVSGGCVIGGGCFAAGALDPGNPCRSCNPAVSSNGWTSLAAGVACSDGQFCTSDDVCNGEGRCLGAARDCNAGSAGCASVCDEAADRCRSDLSACTIDGACVAAGAVDPNNPCRECNPLLALTAWSNKASLSSCDDGLYCTTNEVCNTQGVCTGAPRGCGGGDGTCGNSCNEALDTCSAGVAGCNIDGVCRAAGDSDPTNTCRICNPTLSTTTWSLKGAGTSCSDGLFCTSNDTCDAAGVCSGAATACSDGLGCTTDSCDETARRCVATVSTGCLIDGSCQASGATDPRNSCHSCVPASSTTAWTNKAANAACDDGQFCTIDDTCNAQVVCVGTLRSCSGGGGCTSFCDEASDSCRDDVDGCAVDELCVAAGVDDPSNSCRTCNPDLSATAWSLKPAGTSCTDNLFCTAADSCSAEGVCAGSTRDCADDTTCTADSCDEGADRCSHVTGNSCLIDGACVPAGESAPEGPCRVCDPVRSTSSWSPVAINTSCDDGQFCTLGDACDGAGACVSSGAPCIGDADGCSRQICDELVDACRVVVTTGCKIGMQCVATGAASPRDACLVCRPERSTSAYTFVEGSNGCGRLADGGVDQGNVIITEDGGVRDGGRTDGGDASAPTPTPTPTDEEDEDGGLRTSGGLAGGGLCSASPGSPSEGAVAWLLALLGTGLWLRRRRTCGLRA
jgi:hypothetical protein